MEDLLTTQNIVLVFSLILTAIKTFTAHQQTKATNSVTRKHDLEKTLEAAEDAVPVVIDAIKGQVPKVDAIERGVEFVESLRGHDISAMLRSKARARIKRRIRNL